MAKKVGVKVQNSGTFLWMFMVLKKINTLQLATNTVTRQKNHSITYLPY